MLKNHENPKKSEKMEEKKQKPEGKKSWNPKVELCLHFFWKHCVCFSGARLCVEAQAMLYYFLEKNGPLLGSKGHASGRKPGYAFPFSRGHMCFPQKNIAFILFCQNLKKTKQKPKSLKNQGNQIKPQNCADQTKTKEPKFKKKIK